MIEAALFRSRDFTAATIALFLFFVAFATWLLITVLFLQGFWHYSAVRAGLAIAPGPAVSALFAVNGGRIAARFGRVWPAVIGPLLLAVASLFWLTVTPAHPSYLTGFLPGLPIAGASAGLTQAPLFASAGTLPADRATTGSAVLNMSRQVGSAVGVAVLVALLAAPHPGSIAVFHRGWIFEMAVGVAASLAVILPRAVPARPRSATR